jgi:divalent metal cation (Fe/Co/Zn/Cd) transporter
MRRCYVLLRAPMPAQPKDREHLLRRGLTFEALTVAWNVAEAAAAIAFGWLAGSVALVAFGLDSVIEVVAAAALLRRLRSELRGDDPEQAERRERKALGIVGWTFFALGAYVLIDAAVALYRHHASERTVGGLVVVALASLAMPALGWAKLRVGRAVGSKALVADAKESFACALLSATVLLGVGLNAAFGWWWADPVAAILLVPFLVHEGREALEEARGQEEEEEEEAERSDVD